MVDQADADYRRPPAPPGKSGLPGLPAPGRRALERRPPGRRPRPIWRILRIAAGFALLLFGTIGLFLPVLQGVLMILAGLAVLGRDLPWARAATDWLAAFVRRRAARRAGRRRGRGNRAATRTPTA